MKKKFLLMLSAVAFVVCLLAISASAVNVDGIDYSFSGEEATVTSSNQSCQLTVVDIPATVTYEGVTYTVTTIANSAFKGNSVVTSITTPSTIKSIKEHAFRSMSALKTITINASAELTAFNDAEVYECKALVKADLSGCIGLIDMGNGGTYDHTFTNCSSLTEVILPKSLKVVGTSAFNGCSSLAEIELPAGLEEIRGNAFTSCAFKTIEIPAGVTSIGNYAFQSCRQLVSMNLPEGLTYLGHNNFQYTQVEKIVFPSTLVTATKDMFNSVKTLHTIVFANSDVSNYTTSVLSSCGPLNYVFYAGEDASVLTDRFSALKSHTLVSFEQYLEDIKNPEFTGYSSKVIVYGTENCAACGDVDTSEYGFIFENLLSPMYMGAACANCGAKNVSETYNAVFVDLGYSTFELNGKCSIVQGFKIDYSSLAKYNENCDDKIGVFGVLAAAERKVGDIAFDENGVALENVLNYEIGTGHTYFEIKIANIPASEKLDEETYYTDAKFHLCAYVSIGDEIYYVSEGYVGTTLGEAVSYNDLKLIAE